MLKVQPSHNSKSTFISMRGQAASGLVPVNKIVSCVTGITICLLLFACSSVGKKIIPTPVGQLLPGKQVEINFYHNDRERSYLVYVPRHAGKRQSLPVVLNLHAGGSNAKVQQQYSRMNTVADRYNFIAVYPNGTGDEASGRYTWNAGVCCGEAQQSNADDVHFLRNVLDDLHERRPFLRKKVYATGFSNGAMMTYRLASEAADIIAAIAPVAGAINLENFSAQRPMPLIHFHSEDDPNALYSGGKGLSLINGSDSRAVVHPSVEQVVHFWALHNYCDPEPQTISNIVGMPDSRDEGIAAVQIEYGICREGARVVLWRLTGAGHVWPGGAPDYLEHILGTSTSVISANEIMWNFFKDFSLKE